MRRSLPGGLELDDDPARVDLDEVHRYLSNESYWANGIPRDLFDRSLERSLNFGLFEGEPGRGGTQIGFSRVVTDGATFAWLCDVFVLPEYRGRGLATWLIETVVGHPDLQMQRGFVLATRDAHGLYAKFGFTAPAAPERWMERWSPSPYARPRAR